MITIQIGNTQGKLTTNDKLFVRKKLVPLFSFRPRGYMYDARYKRRIWDGYTKFISDDGKFLTGLWPEIEHVLKELNVPYQMNSSVKLVKWRTKPTPELITIPDANAGVMRPLRDFQVEFLERARLWQRGIIKAATGAGKTAIIAGLVKMTADPGKTNWAPTLILMRNRTLGKQLYDELKSMGVNDIGLVHGEHWEPARVTVALFQSAHKLKDLFPYIELLIVDEVHETVGKEGTAIFRALKNTYNRYGFSATPFKSNDQVHNYRVKGYFGPMLGEMLTAELQERGILSQSRVHIYGIDEPSDYKFKDMEYKDAYDQLVVNNWHFHRRVAEIVNERCQTGRTLLIVERIDHGDIMAKLIPGSIWVQGKDNDQTREWVREQLRTSPNCIAIATRIFMTGIDLRLHNLFNLAGLMAETATIQRFGRGLRPAPDKELLDYYDFYFTNNKYLKKHSRARIKLLQKEGHAFVLEDQIEIPRLRLS